ncbi:hypothetical protein [Microbacterium alcoholitolerans]|uniref:hypothetical protein n=1 Tax=unclassified Microbacterium TaxID=2609290 RepID=UPI003D17E30D
MSAPEQGANEPLPSGAKGGRSAFWVILLVLLGGYALWQVWGLVTTKDAVPPAWVITVPADAALVEEPRISYANFRVTTYMTIRPTDGRTAADLLDEMGLSGQPTQIGPTPLDWRPLWVYARPVQDGVELRLVYRQDLHDGPAP